MSPYLLRPLRCVEEVLAERAQRERGARPGTRPRRPRLQLIYDTYDMQTDGAGKAGSRS